MDVLGYTRRPLREGVGRNGQYLVGRALCVVALYARAWVEIVTTQLITSDKIRRPLREGVGRN